MSTDVWGLISDVHGNFVALEQALDLLAANGAMKYAFLGDYLGRGDSDRCVERIREVADIAIVGNRDLDWQDRVSAASKAWVLSLPRTAQHASLLVSHGDPRLTPRLSTSEIRREFARAWAAMDEHQATIWAFGHSHFARLWRKQRVADAAELLRDHKIAMEPGWRYVVNVGTTGLPFPGKGGPSVALIDFTKQEIRQISLERV
jgi:predicted phosphodiesterase